jgi:hypothetical protein
MIKVRKKMKKNRNQRVSSITNNDTKLCRVINFKFFFSILWTWQLF